MSHKETGSLPLSYRCSHEHRTVTQLSWRISSSLSLSSLVLPPSPRQSGKSVSDLTPGSETLVPAWTSFSSGPLAALRCRGKRAWKQWSSSLLRLPSVPPRLGTSRDLVLFLTSVSGNQHSQVSKPSLKDPTCAIPSWFYPSLLVTKKTFSSPLRHNLGAALAAASRTFPFLKILSNQTSPWLFSPLVPTGWRCEIQNSKFLLLMLNRAMRSKIIQCGEASSELCSKVEGTVHFISTLPPQCCALMSLPPPTYEFI